jgi:cytochrome oxidase Cu insertion factor (SCO1/SenC/PrrC family)
MSRPVKILTFALWALLVVVMFAFLATGRFRARSKNELPVLGRAPEFTLTDQSGNQFSSASLAGKVWAADFIFTRCATSCPIMTGKMLRAQAKLKDSSVRLLSFSVDPEYDSPEVLTKYARDWGADTRQWTFLTGSREAVADVARGMLIEVTPAAAGSPIVHSTHFLLVDAQGNIRGVYSGEDDQGWQNLVADARELDQLR